MMCYHTAHLFSVFTMGQDVWCNSRRCCFLPDVRVYKRQAGDTPTARNSSREEITQRHRGERQEQNQYIISAFQRVFPSTDSMTQFTGGSGVFVFWSLSPFWISNRYNENVNDLSITPLRGYIRLLLLAADAWICWMRGLALIRIDSTHCHGTEKADSIFTKKVTQTPLRITLSDIFGRNSLLLTPG